MSKKESEEAENSGENSTVRLQHAKIYRNNFNIIIELPDE